MKKDFLKILFCVGMVVILTFAVKTNAISEDFSLEVSPQNPGPSSTVSARIVTYSFDIDRAEISWLVNDSVKAKGTGLKNFNFSVGSVGSRISLAVVAITKEGLRIEKSITFRPAGLDILWEAESYTPAFYKGKAMPAPESVVKITAWPEFIYGGEKISPNNLYYDWQINSKNKPDLSGLNKKSFTYKLSKLSAEDEIAVTVSSYNKTIVAEKRIKIKSVSPKVVFYQEQPLEGVAYNNALSDTVFLSENAIGLRAEPYFFSSGFLNSLEFNWKINNKETIPDEKNTALDLRLENQDSGSALINLRIQNPLILLQSAENNLRINFGI